MDNTVKQYGIKITINFKYVVPIDNTDDMKRFEIFKNIIQLGYY